ncbi:MAG TPA: tRNA (guanosine(46)-N7)-methyltransferase TrmB [Cyclobacteriaceae bacterium]|nr:tRNA (guanosine(46)-N7)-methyltransferase TrmB [Cyclobacteriaceae bacterium]
MKQKLERFRIISERDNVLEPGKEIYFEVRGHWNSMFFKNENPITLELACGRGEYTVGLANRFPNRNYVGLDLKGDRIWKGSTLAVEQNLVNVAFVRAQILTIENFFQIGEVDEIWLTFPDPRPKVRDIKRRLTNSRFLDLYKKVLKPEGFFRFKTDNTDLFHYTLEELATRNDIVNLRLTEDLYDSDLQPECFDIQTKYEQMFSEQGEKIKYLRFNFDH